MEDSVIIDDLCIDKAFTILVVTPALVRDATYRIDKPISCYKGDHDGYFTGWNNQNVAIIQPVSFKYDYYLQLSRHSFIDESDFPVGSFITMGDDIVGIHSSVAKRIVRYFRPVSVYMDAAMQNIFENGRKLQEMRADPYPDAVVSFWRVDEQNLPEKLLYLGALIKPNWVLIPATFFETSETLNNIRIYTGRRMKKDNIHDGTLSNFINFKIVGIKLIPGYSRLIIVVMEPGIRLPTPYVVTNSDVYGKTYYEGDLTRWGTNIGAMKKRITLNYFQGFFDVAFEKNSTELPRFPLGSFLVKENNLIAFLLGVHGGQPMFLLLHRNESRAIRNIIESEDYFRFDCHN